MSAAQLVTRGGSSGDLHLPKPYTLASAATPLGATSCQCSGRSTGRPLRSPRHVVSSWRTGWPWKATKSSKSILMGWTTVGHLCGAARVSVAVLPLLLANRYPPPSPSARNVDSWHIKVVIGGAWRSRRPWLLRPRSFPPMPSAALLRLPFPSLTTILGACASSASAFGQPGLTEFESRPKEATARTCQQYLERRNVKQPRSARRD